MHVHLAKWYQTPFNRYTWMFPIYRHNIGGVFEVDFGKISIFLSTRKINIEKN
jgi:hypothetical protein